MQYSDIIPPGGGYEEVVPPSESSRNDSSMPTSGFIYENYSTNGSIQENYLKNRSIQENYLKSGSIQWSYSRNVDTRLRGRDGDVLDLVRVAGEGDNYFGILPKDIVLMLLSYLSSPCYFVGHNGAGMAGNRDVDMITVPIKIGLDVTYITCDKSTTLVVSDNILWFSGTFYGSNNLGVSRQFNNTYNLGITEYWILDYFTNGRIPQDPHLEISFMETYRCWDIESRSDPSCPYSKVIRSRTPYEKWPHIFLQHGSCFIDEFIPIYNFNRPYTPPNPPIKGSFHHQL